MSMVDSKYRVVVDGINCRTGTVPGPLMGRGEAMAGFDTAVDTFDADIRAGDMRVSVLDDAEWQKRGN
jgi:hypothetical protein